VQKIIELIVRVRESASDLKFVVDETDQVMRSLRQVTTQLQEGMTKSRMAPFSQTADHLPRAIRDMSLKLHKQAKLKVEGGDVLIDQMILEHLLSPMTIWSTMRSPTALNHPKNAWPRGNLPSVRSLSRHSYGKSNRDHR